MLKKPLLQQLNKYHAEKYVVPKSITNKILFCLRRNSADTPIYEKKLAEELKNLVKNQIPMESKNEGLSNMQAKQNFSQALVNTQAKLPSVQQPKVTAVTITKPAKSNLPQLFKGSYIQKAKFHTFKPVEMGWDNFPSRNANKLGMNHCEAWEYMMRKDLFSHAEHVKLKMADKRDLDQLLNTEDIIYAFENKILNVRDYLSWDRAQRIDALSLLEKINHNYFDWFVKKPVLLNLQYFVRLEADTRTALLRFFRVGGEVFLKNQQLSLPKLAQFDLDALASLNRFIEHDAGKQIFKENLIPFEIFVYLPKPLREKVMLLASDDGLQFLRQNSGKLKDFVEADATDCLHMLEEVRDGLNRSLRR